MGPKLFGLNKFHPLPAHTPVSAQFGVLIVDLIAELTPDSLSFPIP